MTPVNVVAAAVAASLVAFSLRRLLFVCAAVRSPRPMPHAGGSPPTIVVIVPARNEAAVVPDLLVALARTDYPSERLAFVLVDDASSDRTRALFSAFAAAHPRAAVLALPEQVGPYEALNRAIAVAPASELVAVCDADLRPRPDWLAHLAAAFADPTVGSAAAYLAPRNARSTWIARYAAVESWLHQLVTSAAKDRLGLDPPSHGAAAFRRAALSRIGRFPPGVPGGDVWASIALARAGFRTRFVVRSRVDNAVVANAGDYWRQHLRWARNMLAAPSRQREPASRLGLALRLEARLMATGYADRLSVVAAVALWAVDELPLWPALAYVAIAGAEAVVAICKAGERRHIARFLAATAAIFPLDALASLAAIGMHLLGSPRRWMRLDTIAVARGGSAAEGHSGAAPEARR